MAGIVHIVTRLLLLLLLLSFIMTGLNGEDGLIFAGRAYDNASPCEEGLVCFPIRRISTSRTNDYITIVSNVETAISEDEDLKCTLDVGRHPCQRRPDVFSPHNTIPELILMPGKTVSLRCVMLAYVEKQHCYSQRWTVRLTWVDEAGTNIEEDSQHQIIQESYCDITLTVTLQSPGNKKFRCQASTTKQVLTSVELGVRVPAPNGRGRGLIIEPENQGGNQDTIGAAVGVVGCVVLTVLVALFVVNRRRTRSRLPDESFHTISTNNVINADDVIYAEIILPVGGDRVQVHDWESTEYACVQYK